VQPGNVVVTQFTSIVFQNASKCTISKDKIQKYKKGGYPLPKPHPRPRLHSSNPLQTTCLATGLATSTSTKATSTSTSIEYEYSVYEYEYFKYARVVLEYYISARSTVGASGLMVEYQTKKIQVMVLNLIQIICK